MKETPTPTANPRPKSLVAASLFALILSSLSSAILLRSSDVSSRTNTCPARDRNLPTVARSSCSSVNWLAIRLYEDAFVERFHLLLVQDSVVSLHCMFPRLVPVRYVHQ